MEKEREQNTRESKKPQKTFGELLAAFREENSTGGKESAESGMIKNGRIEAEQNEGEASNEIIMKKEIYIESEDEEAEEEIDAEWLELLSGMYF